MRELRVKVLRSPDELMAYRAGLSGAVGFVPTMGALHKGHLALVKHAKRNQGKVIASIFVNPTQFNDPLDLQSYPRCESADRELLEATKVDALFMPTAAQMYADGSRYQVAETSQSVDLCGADRPGHFTGVLTVVLKLLNLVRPTHLYLGEKDYQQYQLIKGLVNAFFLNIEVIAVPTVREQDGLAMSSRNRRLSAIDRKTAPKFFQILSSNLSDEVVIKQLIQQGFTVDYVKTIDGRRFGAVQLGTSGRGVRLIDNVRIEP